VKLRDGNKIYHIQKDLSKNMNKIMSECLIDDENERKNLEDLLAKMLEFNYKNRIKPEDALKHIFLEED
jgi:serine/threonine protein kinase